VSHCTDIHIAAVAYQFNRSAFAAKKYKYFPKNSLTDKEIHQSLIERSMQFLYEPDQKAIRLP